VIEAKVSSQSWRHEFCGYSEYLESALGVDRHERPFAAIGHHLKMLQCGPSLRPFVQSAAFCWLKRRSAGQSVLSLRLRQ
jgi:hypothetical protein